MAINNEFLSLTSRNFAYRTYAYKTENTEQLNNLQDTQETVEETENISTEDIEYTKGEMLNGIYTDIKAAIYNYCHPKTNNISSSYGTTFDEICTKLGLGPGKTIQKKKLTQLINANGSGEDGNNSLYGGINRAFSSLGSNDTITYNDLMLFFMRGNYNADNDMTLSEYKNAVEIYANKTEQQYLDCSTDQAKLEFIIQKTEQYLTESNMTLQLAALNRLKGLGSENNPANGNQTANVGQIAFGDLGGIQSDGSYIGGGYQPTLVAGNVSENTHNGKTYDVSVWIADFDNDWMGDWTDGGITLNGTVLLNNSGSHPWYEVVEILVHELTHATAYYYYDVGLDKTAQKVNSLSYSEQGFQFMINNGIMSAGAYDKTDWTDSELAQLVDSMWGEYAAYITSCNYMDSIGGDVFDSGKDLCVSESLERQAIYDHIDTFGYNSPNYEPEPLNTDLTTWNKYNKMFYA